MRRRLAGVALSLGVVGGGCRDEAVGIVRDGPAPVSSASSAKQPVADVVNHSSFRLKKTAEIAGDALFHRRVDALARRPRVQGEALFRDAGGNFNPAYPDVRDLLLGSTRDQRVALLQHESPIVRMYLAEYFIGQHGTRAEDLENLYPLLSDGTRVETLTGCVGMTGSIGWQLSRELAGWFDPDRADEALFRLLIRALRDPTVEGRDQIMLYLGAPWENTLHPALVTVIGEVIRKGDEPAVLFRSLEVARLHGLTLPRAWIKPHTVNADERVSKAAVAFLAAR